MPSVVLGEGACQATLAAVVRAASVMAGSETNKRRMLFSLFSFFPESENPPFLSVSEIRY